MSRDEATALRLLAGTWIPAPRIQATDLPGMVVDAPSLVVTWLPGEPAWAVADRDDFLAGAAEVLVAIHAVQVPSNVDLRRYVPYRGADRLEPPADSKHPELWLRVAEVLERPRPDTVETFIHRDYHPGNVLWGGSRVSGVIDWATAAWGPPGIDLARMRVNLALHYGPEVADRFVGAYVAAGGDPAARDPYWDLLDAADLLLDLAPAEPGGVTLIEPLERYVEHVLRGATGG